MKTLTAQITLILAGLFLSQGLWAETTEPRMRLACKADRPDENGRDELVIAQQEDISQYSAMDIVHRRKSAGENILFSFHFYEGGLKEGQEVTKEFIDEVYRTQTPSEKIELEGNFIINRMYFVKKDKNKKDENGEPATVLQIGFHYNPVDYLFISEWMFGGLFPSRSYDCGILGMDRAYIADVPVQKNVTYDESEWYKENDSSSQTGSTY